MNWSTHSIRNGKAWGGNCSVQEAERLQNGDYCDCRLREFGTVTIAVERSLVVVPPPKRFGAQEAARLGMTRSWTLARLSTR
jgi:hypothetical protein